MTTLLVILDGWGYRQIAAGNAIAKASTPTFDKLVRLSHNSLLKAHGLAVGLPEHQCGNSEVGHLTLGVGCPIEHPRVQIISWLKQAVETGCIPEPLKPLLSLTKPVHLVGLHSQGGVHGLEDITFLWCEFFHKFTQLPLNVHLITDGRDQPYGSLSEQLERWKKRLDENQWTRVNLASLCGRFFALDRDSNFDRTKKYVDALLGQAYRQQSHHLTTETIERVRDVPLHSEEFLEPIIAKDFLGIQPGECVINMNFRTDRARQWVEMLLQRVDCDFYSTVALDHNLQYQVLCPQIKIEHSLTRFCEVHRKTQLRLTESEKQPHVSYFFDGMTNLFQKSYELQIVPSHKVDSWDKAPLMQAEAIAQKAAYALQKKCYDFLLVNLTNADLVGHSGNFQATVQAVEAVDNALRIILESLDEESHLIVTADHGNAEQMLTEYGQPHTAHTCNLVPCLYKGPFLKSHKIQPLGELSQVTSTLALCLGLSPHQNWSPPLLA